MSAQVVSIAVGRGLAALDEERRLLVQLVAVQGFTYEQAAGLLGISVRTAARRYEEAMQTCQ